MTDHERKAAKMRVFIRGKRIRISNARSRPLRRRTRPIYCRINYLTCATPIFVLFLEIRVMTLRQCGKRVEAAASFLEIANIACNFLVYSVAKAMHYAIFWLCNITANALRWQNTYVLYYLIDLSFGRSDTC